MKSQAIDEAKLYSRLSNSTGASCKGPLVHSFFDTYRTVLRTDFLQLASSQAHHTEFISREIWASTTLSIQLLLNSRQSEGSLGGVKIMCGVFTPRGVGTSNLCIFQGLTSAADQATSAENHFPRDDSGPQSLTPGVRHIVLTSE